ncbi:hypothetical protein QT991_23205 [Microcoleus sp. S36a_D3]|uniref:hypothetical protein n=1 Tax=Microcoleus sp. S1D4 TaxID=3055413 RepID=UPI002FD3AA57
MIALPSTILNPKSETVTDLTNSRRPFAAGFSEIVQRSTALQTVNKVPHLAAFDYYLKK